MIQNMMTTHFTEANNRFNNGFSTIELLFIREITIMFAT